MRRKKQSSALSIGLINDNMHSCLACRLATWRTRKREEEDDLAFPDEIDTPKEISARVRFQRYRGMRSLRTSPWDPYENLPRDYARIFQFEDFKRTERSVRRRAEQEGGGLEVNVIRPYWGIHLTF
jgi:pre-rRNA-processing protein TSR1